METYWVSAIILNDGDKKPWLLTYGSCQLSLKMAMKEIAQVKSTFTTLSAWVDMFDEKNIKQTVFHECYINAFGDIDN